MRLLHIITALHTGGAERMLAHLSHAWAGRAELHLAYLKPVHTLASAFHPATRLHCIGLDAGTRGRLRRLIKDIQPVVVHTHLVHADVLGLWAAKGLPVQKWSTLHNAKFRTGKADLAFQLGYQLLLGHMATDTELVSISQAVADHAVRTWDVAPERVHLVRNPLHVPKPFLTRAEARQRLGLSEQDRVLTFLGRLEPQKGLPFLLQALADLQTEAPITYLVGEGGMDAALKQQASELGLLNTGRVRFMGLTAEPGLYLAAADALVLPSLFEGLGNVIAEAFAFGLPVIASDLEGPAEIIRHRETGLLVPPGQPRLLAEAIRELFASEERRHQMGRAAKAVADAWPSPESYASRLLELYRRH